MRPALEFIKSYCGNKLIVGAEIGVFVGDNAVEMLVGLPNLNQLYLVDNNAQGGTKIAIEKTEPYWNRVFWMMDGSPESAQFIVDNSLDFVYIDALHTEEAVSTDITTWGKKVKEDGIICGHDYTERGEAGVKKAVDKLFGDRVRIGIIPEKKRFPKPNHDWWVIK